MTIAARDDVTEFALSALPAPFQGKPRIASILASVTNRVQDLETVAYEIITLRLIESATGIYLDRLGRIVGEPRYGRVDSDYRLGIRGRILANRSNGKHEELRAIVSLLFAGETFSVLESSMALAFVLGSAHTYDEAEQLYRLLDDAAGSGVSIESTFPVSTLGTFRFCSSDGLRTGTDRGFSFTELIDREIDNWTEVGTSYADGDVYSTVTGTSTNIRLDTTIDAHSYVANWKALFSPGTKDWIRVYVVSGIDYLYANCRTKTIGTISGLTGSFDSNGYLNVALPSAGSSAFRVSGVDVDGSPNTTATSGDLLFSIENVRCNAAIGGVFRSVIGG